MRRSKRLVVMAVALGAWLATGCMTTTEINGQQVAVSQGTSPPPTEAEARKRATIRLQLAATYYQKGQFAVATEEAQRALKIDPAYGEAYGLMGLINMDLGRPGDAESSFQKALQLDGSNPEILNNYGWFLCHSGRERESIDYFRRAADSKLYETPAMAMQNAGLCMLRVKDTKEAEGFFKRSFELDASNPVTKFQLARLYLSTRQFDRAKFYYGLLPRGLDANADVLWLGLRIAHAEGDVRTAQQLANDLRRRFPDSREADALRREAFDE
jgi:type IV pilus assembly protein PilF